MNYGFIAIVDICVDWIGRNIYYAELYSGNICEFESLLFLQNNLQYPDMTYYIKE